MTTQTLNETRLYFEDLIPGEGLCSPAETIDREEMIAFARRWDPLPIHIDEKAAMESFGGLIAPGLFTLAIKLRLIHRSRAIAVVASMGFDEVRFRTPLRPGDTVMLTQRWLECRRSSSRTDRGIVTADYSLVNQKEEVVLSHRDTLLVKCRRIA